MNSEILLDILIASSTMVVVIPAAILCYVPMANQRRKSVPRIVISCAILYVISFLATAWIYEYMPQIDATVALLPFLGIFFAYYALSVRARVSQCAGIFFMVCAFCAITSCVSP